MHYLRFQRTSTHKCIVCSYFACAGISCDWDWLEWPHDLSRPKWRVDVRICIHIQSWSLAQSIEWSFLLLYIGSPALRRKWWWWPRSHLTLRSTLSLGREWLTSPHRQCTTPSGTPSWGSPMTPCSRWGCGRGIGYLLLLTVWLVCTVGTTHCEADWRGPLHMWAN